MKGMKIELERDYTLAEAAALLGVEVSTLRHQLRNGRITGQKFGPGWAIAGREIERYRGASRGKPGRRAAAE